VGLESRIEVVGLNGRSSGELEVVDTFLFFDIDAMFDLKKGVLHFFNCLNNILHSLILFLDAQNSSESREGLRLLDALYNLLFSDILERRSRGWLSAGLVLSYVHLDPLSSLTPTIL
jgi:hypothetical protein